MKRRFSAVVLAACLALAAGCADKRDTALRVRIAPSIRTRVSGLHFETGDRIGLTIAKSSGNYIENRMMTYQESSFADAGLLWYDNLNEKSTLTAYYPYSEDGVPAEFSVATDQTGGCAPSDLLGAVKTDVTPSSAPVGMLFYHLMSQLTIVVTNNSSASVSGVTVKGLIPTATVDFSVPGAVAKPGVAPAEIKTFEVTPDASYRVILVPQQAELTVTVATSNGKSHTKSITSATFESGKRYDMSVVVTNEDIGLALSGDIGEWGEGGSLDEGGTGDDTGGGNTSAELVYGGETYRTVRIDGRTWMAENLRYQPAGVEIKNGVWYPDTASGVAEKGLLYNYATATGGVASMAGTPLRGICPEGWHIPDAEELQSLVQSAQCPSDFFCPAGFWMKTTTINRYNDSKGYLMGCDLPQEGTCCCLQYSADITPQAYTVSVEYGISLRCVKD